MRKLLAQTFAIQGIGVMLMVGVTIMVARWGGTVSQGSFAIVKSTTDLMVAAFSLGLPPAIVFLLNRTGTGHAAVYRLILRYGLALMLVLPLLSLPLIILGGIGQRGEVPIIQAVSIGLAGAWLTQFALLRGLLLTYTDGPVFSALSIMQWAVIAIVALVLLNRSAYVFEIAYALSGAVSLCSIFVYLRRFQSGDTKASSSEIEWSLLRRQAMHALLQASIMGLQPFLTNLFVVHYAGTLTDVGLFSVASMVVTLPNLLVAMAAPVLYNRWSKSLDRQGMLIVRRNALLLGIAAQLAAVACFPFVQPVIRLIFGQPFVAATEAVYLLLLAALPIVCGRILTPALQGLGLTGQVTMSCIGRLVAAFVAATVATIYGMPILLAAAVGWCVGEYVALAFLLRPITSRESPPPPPLKA